MNTAVRILCILSKYHHITDLLLNVIGLLSVKRILFKVISFKIIRHILFYNARDLKSDNKLLSNP